MKGNLKFTVMPSPGGYKIICQYGEGESSWGPFKTLDQVADRIRVALENTRETKNHVSASDPKH